MSTMLLGPDHACGRKATWFVTTKYFTLALPLIFSVVLLTVVAITVVVFSTELVIPLTDPLNVLEPLKVLLPVKVWLAPSNATPDATPSPSVMYCPYCSDAESPASLL